MLHSQLKVCGVRVRGEGRRLNLACSRNPDVHRPSQNTGSEAAVIRDITSKEEISQEVERWEVCFQGFLQPDIRMMRTVRSTVRPAGDVVTGKIFNQEDELDVRKSLSSWVGDQSSIECMECGVGAGFETC